MKKCHFWEHFCDFSVAFAVFVVVFFVASFWTKKGGVELEQAGASRSKPDQAGAPGVPKKNSQLLEFRSKAKKLESVNAKMLQPREKTTNAHTGASPVSSKRVHFNTLV